MFLYNVKRCVTGYTERFITGYTTHSGVTCKEVCQEVFKVDDKCKVFTEKLMILTVGLILTYTKRFYIIFTGRSMLRCTIEFMMGYTLTFVVE